MQGYRSIQYTEVFNWKKQIGILYRFEIIIKKDFKYNNTRLHKSRSSRDELEFDLSNFV